MSSLHAPEVSSSRGDALKDTKKGWGSVNRIAIRLAKSHGRPDGRSEPAVAPPGVETGALHFGPVPDQPCPLDHRCASAGALLFDLDGTLADTMPLHLDSWTRVLSTRGVTLERDRYFSMAGVPTRKILAILSREQGVALDFDELVLLKERLFLEQAHLATPIEPFFSLARDFHRSKPMAVVSGGIRRSVTRTLDLIGASSFFPTVVTAEDTQLHKPDPDPFLLAASRLGVDPAACLVFEDGDPGIQAATKAGMQVIDVRLDWRILPSTPPA
jgi:beta-phosphoglucomutase-like phosphatase (HAD superfamily)